MLYCDHMREYGNVHQLLPFSLTCERGKGTGMFDHAIKILKGVLSFKQRQI